MPPKRIVAPFTSMPPGRPCLLWPPLGVEWLLFFRGDVCFILLVGNRGRLLNAELRRNGAGDKTGEAVGEWVLGGARPLSRKLGIRATQNPAPTNGMFFRLMWMAPRPRNHKRTCGQPMHPSHHANPHPPTIKPTRNPPCIIFETEKRGGKEPTN